MNKKITSIVILFVLICSTFSCSSLKQINLVKGESWNKKGSIVTVFTKSGDLIEFLDGNPATVAQDKIIGKAVDKTGVVEYVSIPYTEVEVVWVEIVSGKTILVPLAGYGVLCSFLFIAMLAGGEH